MKCIYNRYYYMNKANIFTKNFEIYIYLEKNLQKRNCLQLFDKIVLTKLMNKNLLK